MPATSMDRALSAVALVLAGAGPLMAQRAATVDVDAQTLVSSNPFLQEGPDRGAALFQLSVKPGLKLGGATGSHLDLTGTVSEKVFTRRYGRFLVGDFGADGAVRHNEYLSVKANFAFEHDLAIDELTSSIAGAADPRSIRTNYNAWVAVEWQPDAHSKIRPELAYEATDYTATALLQNTRNYRASVLASRKISPFVELGIRGEALFGTVENNPDVRSQGIFATLKWDPAQHWSLSASLGAERSDNRIGPSSTAAAVRATRTTLDGSARLCRETRHGSVCLTTQASNGVSALGGLERTIMALATVEQRLGVNSSIDVAAEYRRSTNHDYPALTAIRATVKLERRLGRSFTLSALAQYLRRRLTDGAQVGAPYAGLQLRYQPVAL